MGLLINGNFTIRKDMYMEDFLKISLAELIQRVVNSRLFADGPLLSG